MFTDKHLFRISACSALDLEIDFDVTLSMARSSPVQVEFTKSVLSICKEMDGALLPIMTLMCSDNDDPTFVLPSRQVMRMDSLARK
jgi:hypothetical protein